MKKKQEIEELQEIIDNRKRILISCQSENVSESTINYLDKETSYKYSIMNLNKEMMTPGRKISLKDIRKRYSDYKILEIFDMKTDSGKSIVNNIKRLLK